MDSKAFIAGILTALLMFVFGLGETGFTSDIIVTLCFVLTGLALLSWAVIVLGREFGISKTGAKSIN